MRRKFAAFAQRATCGAVGYVRFLVMGESGLALPSFEELYERIVALPQGITGEILVPGVLSTMSRPGKVHRKSTKAIGRVLDRFDRSLGGTGWWIEEETEIRFPLGRLAVPDLCGFRVERVPELPDENPLTVLPDWCCEVLSPSTAGSLVNPCPASLRPRKTRSPGGMMAG